MKRVVASAGVFAVGMSGLQGANVTGLTPQEQSKWWIVSGSLRGFYDDNSLNQPDAVAQSGTGFEIHPGISVNLPGERTLFSASYDLTLNYYEGRPSEKIDQHHLFDTLLNHRFSERYDVNAQNSFVYSDEPAVLDGSRGAVDTVVRRGDASAFRNSALIDFSGRMTPVIGFVTGYRNNFRDYTQAGLASYSALFDSVEHQFHLDAQWYRSETTIYFTGYQFGLLDYTSSDPIGFGLIPGLSRPQLGTIFPRSKNNRSHYFYLGLRREFSRQLSTTARVGAQFTDYYNANESSWSPYVDLKADYTYLPGSTLQVGVNVQRGAADTGVVGGELTLDTLAAVFYASLNHRFSSRFSGAVSLNYQNNTYNGGGFDGESNSYFTIDSRVDFKLREYLFAELGYTWSLYASTIPGVDFTRNRVYLGIRATY